eukprot:gb/GFBE01009921.1/.p1 GENE.gb/GFBE01009921.1/~~gb/GFBE01009921.1/.p1  ORF type:complete len:530 (+),score=107.52 gb/GFBE01009921.1/:1-1590(+)
MFQSLLCSYSDSLGSIDTAISRLASSYQRLIVEDGRVDTKTEPGFNAAALFLESLEAGARALRLEPADRSYRTDFTINYRALFPDGTRNYRVDILEASVEQNAVIWVNGDKFEFSAEAMRCAEALQRSWGAMSACLERWSRSSEQPLTFSKPAHKELKNTLLALDTAWAAFEKKYIKELINIEDKARKLIVEAIDCEKVLLDVEAKFGQSQALSPQHKSEYRKLVACIARLNSVANFRRKGRDDLSVEVLFDAMRTIDRCDAAEKNGESTELLSAARSLSGDVVQSFMAMRKYLREIRTCLERVDPHLCNNQGLVARLVDWEESWEVGTRYVQHEMLLNGICDLVAETRLAQRIAPALKDMCEECDVELFMVLPRIIWLRGLAKPTTQLDVFKSLLPHRFLEPSCNSTGNWPCDAELQTFVEQFRNINALLMSNWRSAGRVSDRAAWEILIKRVVSGAGEAEKESAYGTLSPSIRAQAESEVEDFMNKMEGWSMELQRHCAEDWNQFMAILIQCLSGSNRDSKDGPFQV